MNYLGAKGASGVYQAIINLMPPHDTYIECFYGTGVVLEKKAPAQKSIAIDLDVAMLKESSDSVTYIRDNAIDWIARYKPVNRCLYYCDPPYVHQTRTSKNRYKFEMSDDDHRRLISNLKKLDGYVILSGYRNTIYDELIGDWFSFDFQAMTRGGVRTETVWCNFNPGEIHYHTYAGKNFTDRQRIKRKAERWSNNFKKLPPEERQAVLAAILSVNSIDRNNYAS